MYIKITRVKFNIHALLNNINTWRRHLKHATVIETQTTYYAALLPRRGPHIASHSLCLSVCPSICLSIVCPSVPFA